MATVRSPMSPRKPAYYIQAAAIPQAAPGSTTTVMANSISSSRITWHSIPPRLRLAAKTLAAATLACRFCGPAGLPQEPCRLYRNNGNGTFTDVSEKSGIASVKPGYALTAVAADFDGDGWPDIYVACDTSPSLLFRNNHDGTFTEQGLESGVSLSEDGQEQAGMGLGIGDFDCDGNLDIFKTHFRGDTAVLYRNNGKGNFRDVTLRAGLGVETRFVGWGAAIVDLDNDGLPDIFFTTGMVYPEVEQKISESPYKTPNVLFRNLGGESSRSYSMKPGLASGKSIRAAARPSATSITMATSIFSS